MHIERDTLEAALIGYRKMVADISAKITAIELELRGKTDALPTLVKKKNNMSEAGRAAIRKAQIKRWKALRGAA